MATYDVADDGFLNTGAFLGPTAAAQQPLSFCKFGSEYFLVMNIDGSTIEIWHYSGGVRTVYSPTVPPQKVVDREVVVRSDGTNVWLIYWSRPVIPNPYVPPSGPTINPFVPTVDLWNGAGFTSLGTDVSSINNYGFSGENQGFVSHISACACSAEAGALYVMWAENGYSMIAGRPPGGQDAYENVIVTKWDNAGIVSTSVIYAVHIIGPGYTSPFTPPVWSDRIFVTNASGSPVAFYGVPDVIDTLFFNVTYTDSLEMWDVTGPTLLQTAVGSTLNALINQISPLFGAYVGGTRFPDGTTLTKVIVPFAQGGGSSSETIVQILSVPEDGSGPFTLIDGSASEASGLSSSTIDIVDDSENIWTSSAVHQFHRVCPSWEVWEAGPVATILSNYEIEIVGDTIYTIGHENGSGIPGKFGSLSLPILRDFVQCGGGIHIKTQRRH